MIPLVKHSCNCVENKFLEFKSAIFSFTNSKEAQNCFLKTKTHLFNFSEQPKKIHGYCIEKLTSFDETLDHALPNWIFQSVMDKAGQNIQQKIDQVGQYIRAQLRIHVSFNEWLNQNDKETWYEQLDIYLCKLPLKTIYNIVSLLSRIIKSACYAVVHPLKAFNHLAQFLISIAYSFTQPETWCLLGAGLISSSAGQSLMSGNPLFLLGIAIGSTLTVSGLALSAVKAAIEAEEGSKLESAKNAAKALLKQLPETMLVSFCIGLLIGKIQQISLKRFKNSMPELQKQ